VELRKAALVLLGGLAVIASACSGSPASAASTSRDQTASSVFANGGSVTVAVPYLPTNFNPSTPAGANRVTQMVMEQVLPQAFVIDPSYQAETTGFIASAEVVSLIPMTVAYVIDPKATWSDGHPITAADFEYNWQQQLRMAPLLAPSGVVAGYRDIKSVSGSNGGKTVTVVFKSAYSDWEALFSNLIPAHIAEKSGWVSAFSRFSPSKVISGGPFKVSSVKPGKRLVLTRNTNYWGTPAYLKSIVFKVVRSDGQALNGLRTGSISIAEVTPSPQVDISVARDQALGSNISVTTTPSSLLWQLVFNLNDPLVGSRSMREALSLITDRDQLAADSVELDDPLTVAASSRVFAQGQTGSNTEVPAPLYDPAQAAKVFKSLGYLPDKSGILRSYGTGSPLKLTITGPRGNSEIDALELQLQAEWASCGVQLNIVEVPIKDLLKRTLPLGSYQVALAPFVMPAFPTWNGIIYTDPVVPLRTRFAPNLREGIVSLDGSWPWSVPTSEGTEPGATSLGAVTRDITGLDDPGVGAYFDQLMGELNTDTQAQTLSRLDTLLNEDLPTLPLFQQPASLVQQSDIVNVSESPSAAGVLWDAEDWVVELKSATG